MVDNIINTEAAAAAKSRQSCLTLCDPIDGTQQAPLYSPGLQQSKNRGIRYRSADGGI